MNTFDTMSTTGSNSDYTNESNDLDVEAMVRKIMREMAVKSAGDTTVSLSTVSEHKIDFDDIASKDAEEKKKSHTRSKSKSKKIRKSKTSSSSTKDKKKNSKANKENEKKSSLIETLLAELHNLKQEDPSEDTRHCNTGPSIGHKDQPNLPSRTILVKGRTLSDSLSTVTDGFSVSTPSTAATVGTKEFYNGIASKLRSHRNTICIQDASFELNELLVEDNTLDSSEVESVQDDDDFQAAFEPNDMRCLALVSHNEMKSTMKDFVIHYKNVLKKFRLTGTQSTMKMLAEVFADEPEIVFGPSCNSGPLGGDAELVALMAGGKLGGILFFQDPMTSHPHQADIDCLVRQALVHNTVIATTPTTAMTIMEVFRLALKGEGKAELLPSFFFSLQSPTVEAYKNSQKKIVRSRSCVTFEDGTKTQ